jgi:hypothetical protein
MEKIQKSIALVLNKIQSAVMHLSSDEIERLAEKNYDLEIKVVRRRMKDDPEERVPDENFKVLLDKLTNTNSRQEASDFLLVTFETKKPLEQLARFLDLPVLKQDKVENLREKIIEATVGARLRSEAIKGKA